jgi:hypothetical protein
MNMETPNSMFVRASRFFSDRYAYRTQPGYLSELVAFGMIVFIAVWPIILVARDGRGTEITKQINRHGSPNPYIHRPAEEDSRRPANPTP